MNADRKHGKVLVLGMDGLDPTRLQALSERGLLPTFSKLRDSGRVSTLATSNPAESPVAWSCLATGCNPGKHGIFDFIHRNPNTYAPFLSLLAEQPPGVRQGTQYKTPRTMPGFWRYTSDAGVPTTVLRWPVTFPAEQVSGRFLAGLGVPDVSGRFGKHTFYTTRGDVQADDKVVRVAWRDRRLVTHLEGPQFGTPRGQRPLRAKLTVEQSPTGVILSLGRQREELRPNAWSPWFKVRFRWGLLPVCDAIVKFYLAGSTPDLELLTTPVQIDPHKQLWPLTQPPSYGAELARRIGCFYTLGLPEDTNAVTEQRCDLDAFLQQCHEIGCERRAMFEHELQRFDEGVLAFVFDAGDRIQHMFWSIDDPHSPTFDRQRAYKYAHVIPDLYREMDALLAEALEALGPQDALLVVSDHGFGPFRRAVHLNRWLADHGYLKLKSDPGATLLADVDWSRSSAYALGFTSIYLNLAGRESQGVVRPGAEAKELVRELTAGLRKMRDPQDGAPMIRGAYSSCSLYHGAQAHRAPDLIIGFESGYRASWQSVLGAAPRELVVDNDKLWAADHLVDPSVVPGVLATNLALKTPQPAAVDLTPTILNCLDLPVPDIVDGQSWLATPRPSAVPGAPAAAEESPDCPPPVAVGCADASADGLTDRQRAALEQHLSDLGYL